MNIHAELLMLKRSAALLHAVTGALASWRVRWAQVKPIVSYQCMVALWHDIATALNGDGAMQCAVPLCFTAVGVAESMYAA